MILPPEKLNELHLQFQNLVVADQAHELVDFIQGLVVLITSLVGIYIEFKVAAARPQ